MFQFYAILNNRVEKSGSIDSQLEGLDINNNTNNNGPCQNCEEEKQRRLELERIIDALNDEIEESRNLVAALKVQNEEAKVKKKKPLRIKIKLLHNLIQVTCFLKFFL